MNDTQTASVTEQEQQFLSQLRTATNEQHQRLEATPLSQRLMATDVSANDYGAYLDRMRNVIAFCEGEVFPVVAHLFDDMQERQKLPSIIEDLALVRTATRLPAGRPFMAKLPVDNTAFALGFMYVAEGSTLGGRVLLKHIENTLGFGAENGARFFAGYGRDTAKMWKEFLAVLCKYGTENNCQNEITEGAQYAFTSIEQHFSTRTS